MAIRAKTRAGAVGCDARSLHEILYVEDNATDADLFRRSLARGWPEAGVSICASIAAARLQLEQAPVFDAVVSA